MNGQMAMSGALGLRLVKSKPAPETLESIWRRVAYGLPFGNIEPEVRAWRFRNWPNLWRGLKTVILSQSLDLPCFWGELYLKKIFGDSGRVQDYGLASLRVVTDAGVAFIVDAFQNSVEMENMKYHGFGTGGAAEAAANTLLTTELTTEYASDNVRPTGSTEEGATANIYKTIATLTIDSGTPAITEHGVFGVSTRATGPLLDRSLFSAINLVASDSIVATYQLTLTSGS